MDLLQYDRMKTAIQVSASPGREAELEAVERTLSEMLMASGLFEEVEVGHTDDPDHLVVALCKFQPFHAEQHVAARLEQIWADRVRYPFWEAHVVYTDFDHVEFKAASRYSPDGHYVTVHLVAQRAHIPEQRSPRF